MNYTDTRSIEEKIRDTENAIESRILDHQYADSWEQSRQISESIDRLKEELQELQEMYKVNNPTHLILNG